MKNRAPLKPYTPTFARQRTALVHLLRKKGIQDTRVLAALGRVHRHRFLDQGMWRRAYEDIPLPIGLSQTISQPFTVAYQTELLNPQPGERVLEIGTGSGYQAALLAELGVTVFSIERHKTLLDRTEPLLADLGYTIHTQCGDGTLGWPEHAPFDAIIVTAGGDHVPEPLLQQLRQPSGQTLGGRLVIPVGNATQQIMHYITRTGGDTFETQALDPCRFVPLIGAE